MPDLHIGTFRYRTLGTFFYIFNVLKCRLRVLCDQNYYNSTCTTFCRPRDDNFGHHVCGTDGSKICMPGWQGPNCDKAICKPDCDPVYGSCSRPGECE